MDKWRQLFEAILQVVMVPVALFGELERLVGKAGFVQTCCPCLRSIF